MAASDADTFSPTALPAPEDLAKALQVEVVDEEGKPHKFGDLISAEGKTIVVFIRHFYCGLCQDYVTDLATIKPEALTSASASLLIIGCGDYTPIKMYKEMTGFGLPIYANPSKELYVVLGMTKRTLEGAPKGEQKKAYIKHGFTGYLFGGLWNGPMKHPEHIMAAGDPSQLGGEFIFEPGPNVEFASRMKHTADHTDVKDLMEKAGVEYP